MAQASSGVYAQNYYWGQHQSYQQQNQVIFDDAPDTYRFWWLHGSVDHVEATFAEDSASTDVDIADLDRQGSFDVVVELVVLWVVHETFGYLVVVVVGFYEPSRISILFPLKDLLDHLLI